MVDGWRGGSNPSDMLTNRNPKNTAVAKQAFLVWSIVHYCRVGLRRRQRDKAIAKLRLGYRKSQRENLSTGGYVGAITLPLYIPRAVV